MKLLPATTSRGRTIWFVIAIAITFFLAAISLCVGALSSTPSDTVDVLLHGYSTPPTEIQAAVLESRVPRTIVIALVGAALGMAGTLVQGHTRNPLADPGLLGISAGAALAIASGIAFFDATEPLTFVALALTGATLAALLTFVIGGTGKRASDPASLVVAGAAVSALLVAITTTILLRSIQALDKYRFWTSGSVAGVKSDHYVPVIAFLAVGAVLALASGPGLNLLSMGERSARALGLNVRRLQTVGIIAIALLAGGATAIAGPIGFLGLIAPHVSRTIVGQDYRWVLPMSAIWATATLYIADICGRLISPLNVEQGIPAGVMLVFVGVPVFLIAIRRSRFTAT